MSAPPWMVRMDLALNAKGMTSSQLASACGVTRQRFSQLRSGIGTGVKLLPKIAEVLGVRVEWLTLGGLAYAPTWSLTDREFWNKVLYHAEQVATDDELARYHPPRTPAQRDALLKIAERHAGQAWTPEEGMKAAAGWQEWVGQRVQDTPAPILQISGGPDELPIVGTAAAGDGRNFGLSFDHPEIYRWRKKRFLVRVKGDSAVPVALDGQFVVCDPARSIRHNNLVLILTEQGALVKRWCEDKRAPGGGVYASINAGLDSPYLDPKEIKERWFIAGVLFE